MRVEGHTTGVEFRLRSFASKPFPSVDVEFLTTASSTTTGISTSSEDTPGGIIAELTPAVSSSNLPCYWRPTSFPPRISDTTESWLAQALEELDDAYGEARKEGYVPVSDLASANAKGLLSDLAARVAQAPMVHSTPEGGIVIDIRARERDAALLILCEQTGEGVCLYDIGSKQGRARCSDAGDLLDLVGWKALERMGLL